jgi:hypothetical protein
MSDHEIRVHADELEYTSEGLRTGEHLPLRPGVHNRVVVTRPKRVKAVPITLAGFPVDSSFPTPVVLALFLAPRVRDAFGGQLAESTASVLQVFGHAQTEGKLGPNKDLSDRRAQTFIALLAGDVASLQSVADEEGWGERESQVMLRCLGCDPGVVDGEPGAVTEAAVEQFQREYVKGTFHEASGSAPLDPSLTDDGALGPMTRAALIDALVMFASPRVAEERFHPMHRAVGCTEFNQAPDNGPWPGTSRRISLVVHAELPPFHDRAPCTKGDHSVCPVDDAAPHRCLWYRAHVEDPAEAEAIHEHFDLRWLRLPNGKVLLSTLTTVADEEEVRFEVFAADGPVDGSDDPPAGSLDEGISKVLITHPVLGVAQVVWEPPAAFEPGLDGRYTTSDGRSRMPVFRVTHPRTGTVAHDSWPSHQVAVLFDRNFLDRTFTAPERVRVELVCEAQGYQRIVSCKDASPYDDTHYVVRFEGLRPEGTFTVSVDYGNDVRRTLLQDVPFAMLDDHGPEAGPPAPRAETPDAASEAGETSEAGGGRLIEAPLTVGPERWIL